MLLIYATLCPSFPPESLSSEVEWSAEGRKGSATADLPSLTCLFKKNPEHGRRRRRTSATIQDPDLHTPAESQHRLSLPTQNLTDTRHKQS
jgi:hypothetical protein